MEANDALIAARLAQPSRSRPREALSRKELADLINGYIWDHYRQRTPVDENYVGKPERGVVRWPGALYREAIVAVLGAADERDLGFGPTGARRAASADPAEEVGAPMSMAAASTRLLDAMAPNPWPARGRATGDRSLWRAARAFSIWDNLYGGLAREAPLAQLR